MPICLETQLNAAPNGIYTEAYQKYPPRKLGLIVVKNSTLQVEQISTQGEWVSYSPNRVSFLILSKHLIIVAPTQTASPSLNKRNKELIRSDLGLAQGMFYNVRWNRRATPSSSG